MPNQLNNAGNSLIIWKQKKTFLRITACKLHFSNINSIFSLLNELLTRKEMFTLIISKNELILFLYEFNSEEEQHHKDSISEQFIARYSLKKVQNMNEHIIPLIKKVKQDERLIKCCDKDGKWIYYIGYILKSIKNDTIKSQKSFTRFLKALLHTEFLNVIISQFYSPKNQDRINTNWGLMLLKKSNKKEELIKKEESFRKFVKSNIQKLNIGFSQITKKDVEWNRTNFQLLIPWIKHNGVFTDLIDINVLIGERIKEINNRENISTDFEKVEIENVKLVEVKRFLRNKEPYPSVKDLLKTRYKQQETTNIASKSLKTKETILNPIKEYTSLKEFIPKPKTISKTFDVEKIKATIVNSFNELGYRETLIFNHKFDLVLRRSTAYIFVKISSEPLTQDVAYSIVEELNSIAGLRNEFLCIVIAPIIEKNAKKVLRDFNIVHLTLSDIATDNQLKTQIYEHLGESYVFLPLV
ncbi:MAG: hypothetical protein ACTSPI_01665 [Candidatus Heimdallarchaeaceae archaeon]